MGRRTAIQHVEVFHLAFLRALETRLDRGAYVVKGGVNLRAWFGSPRYSDYLDVDVAGIAKTLFEGRIDKLLAGPPLTLVLGAQGLSITRISKPKQTDTTQRWKAELQASGHELPLHTKVEFSRRGASEESAFEPVLS